MDLKPYIQPILKWWWMLVAAGLVAGVSSFVISLGEPPVYQAHTTLMIGQTINDPNPAQNQFYLEQQLAGIYANTAMRQPIRDATMKALDLTWLPEYNVSAVANSQLIEIWVNDTNPVRAQAVAAELANQLILRSPTTNQSDNQTRQEFIQNQLNDLQSQIKETQAEIEKLKSELGNLNSARQISDKQSEIATLDYKLSLLQTNFATLLGNTESGAPNSLTIVEPAELPTTPIGPNRLLTVALSVLIGIGLAAVGAYGIEFFDPTFRTTQDVKKALQISILGEIITLPKESEPIRYTEQNPLSPVADSFRLVKNSLEGIDLGNSLRYIQIVSAEASDGKTMVATNLAITIAKSGKRVLLVDVDLRKTSLTQRLNLQDNRGLSNVFLGDGELSTVITSSSVENLRILPAGTNLDDTSNWFTSPRMHLLLNELEKYADVIILDGTPAIVPDAMELARKVNNVILVVRVNSSRRDMVKYAKEQFDLASVHIIGAIVNGVSLKETYYGGHYKRYAYYSRSETPTSLGSNHHKKKNRITGVMGGLVKERLKNKETARDDN
jgi:capsular exopolysaccharide synthesis family protein